MVEWKKKVEGRGEREEGHRGGGEVIAANQERGFQIPINWICRDFNFRCVWSPSALLMEPASTLSAGCARAALAVPNASFAVPSAGAGKSPLSAPVGSMALSETFSRQRLR